jgi:hypothetical protein
MTETMREITDKLGIDPDSQEAFAIEAALYNDIIGGYGDE